MKKEEEKKEVKIREEEEGKIKDKEEYELSRLKSPHLSTFHLGCCNPKRHLAPTQNSERRAVA